jgi:hypothetical protein
LEHEPDGAKLFFLQFSAQLSAQRKNNKKITHAGGIGNQHLPLALSVFL